MPPQVPMSVLNTSGVSISTSAIPNSSTCTGAPQNTVASIAAAPTA